MAELSGGRVHHCSHPGRRSELGAWTHGIVGDSEHSSMDAGYVQLCGLHLPFPLVLGGYWDPPWVFGFFGLFVWNLIVLSKLMRCLTPFCYASESLVHVNPKLKRRASDEGSLGHSQADARRPT